jgi:hypothetical protein
MRDLGIQEKERRAGQVCVGTVSESASEKSFVDMPECMRSFFILILVCANVQRLIFLNKRRRMCEETLRSSRICYHPFAFSGNTKRSYLSHNTLVNLRFDSQMTLNVGALGDGVNSDSALHDVSP